MYIIDNQEVEAVRRVIESGQLFRYRGGEGGETDQFEAEWAELLGARHALAVTSGTAALTCALAGMDIGPGDEVIVPAYTWMATPVAAITLGAIPVIAEVDESLTLDPADVERKITARTKAIMPVHMCGFPCDMDGLMAVAAEHGLVVLEDACQADGGSYKGKRLGAIGTAGANSFNFFKIITCGEGGAVVTNDTAVYQKALVYHDLGCAFRAHAGDVETPMFIGSNYRMNEILSAILRVQLSRLDGILDTLRAEKRMLMGELSGVSAFSFNPIHDPAGDCATTLGLLFDTETEARRFIDGMKAEGMTVASPIDSGIHVYSNWTPVLEKRGAHHPARDPFKLCGYDVEYSKDMCPDTLAYLKRTVYLGTAINRSGDDLRGLIQTVKKVAGR
ncbi:MAG: DegT/DnrJ/EryC1/StrS family aminotransferase [Candidatus Hydrogenedentes bacterium]|nr:DegT/DnrJ/EryC1/StrS family aminotransferase [Candidatus Hydrogenedentota bacterium]